MCLHKHVHVRISPDNLARLTTWEGLKAEEGRAGWPGRRWIQSKDQNLGSEVKGSTESAEELSLLFTNLREERGLG